MKQAFNEFTEESCSALLKIDVQGAENDVLKDLEHVKKSVKGIIVESSYTNLYSSGATFFDTISLLNKSGFEIIYIENLGRNKNSMRFNYCDIYAVSKDFKFR